MAALARWCFRHRKIVLPAWLIALVLVGGISRSVGSSYTNNFSFPSTDSSRALDVVKANFPAQSGDSDQIVIQAKNGTLHTPEVTAAVTQMLGKVEQLPFVTGVTSPYSSGLISTNGRIGLATVQLDAQAQNISSDQAKQLIKTAQAVDAGLLNVQLGGAAVQQGENQGGGSTDFLVGALLALVVLFFAFRRSLLTAVLPLLTAVVAIGIGTSFIGILSHAVNIPEFATQLSELIALGVGVDYSLFIVNRHRRELLAGRSPEEAAVRALNTSGRAVFVAGLTVCIALLGMFALGLTFLYGVSMGAAFVVLLTMLSALTLLPAMLGFYGHKALSRRDRRMLRADAEAQPGAQVRVDRGGSPFWEWWAAVVERRSAILSVVGLALIVIVALPFFSMRLGLADSGEDPSGSTTKQAYDLLAQGFGPGFNGPLQVVGEINGPGDLSRFDAFVTGLQDTPGVAHVLPPRQPKWKGSRRLRLPRLQPASRANLDSCEQGSRRSAKRHRGVVAGRTRRRHDRWGHRLLEGAGPEASALRRRHHRAGLPVTGHCLPKPPGATDGVSDEHPLYRRRPWSDHRRLPVRLAAARSRLRRSRSDRGVPTGHDVRSPLRAVDGLRGLPRQSHPRGVGEDG